MTGHLVIGGVVWALGAGLRGGEFGSDTPWPAARAVA